MYLKPYEMPSGGVLLDWSTINLKHLAALPVYKKPPTYHISPHLGSACAGNPPGHPSYFVRSVYTQHGNSPRRGAQTVIVHPTLGARVVWSSVDDDRYYAQARRENIEDAWRFTQSKYNERLNRLWIPLPLDNPRVKLWMADRFRQSHRCYVDPSNGDKMRHISSLIVWPVPDYKLQHSTIDLRWREDVIAAYKAADEAANAAIVEQARQFVKPSNHAAVRAIREWYPEYKITSETYQLIKQPPKWEKGSDWWERCSAPY